MSESLTLQSQEDKDALAQIMLADLESQGIRVTRSPEIVSDAKPHFNDGMSQLEHTFAKGAFEGAQKFLSGVLMEDSFGEKHEARRAWRTRMAQKYGDAFVQLDDRNQLRGNVVSNAYGYLSAMAVMFKDSQHSQIQKLIEIAHTLPNVKNYSALETKLEERLEIVRKLQDTSKRVIGLFTSSAQ